MMQANDATLTSAPASMVSDWCLTWADTLGDPTFPINLAIFIFLLKTNCTCVSGRKIWSNTSLIQEKWIIPRKMNHSKVSQIPLGSHLGSAAFHSSLFLQIGNSFQTELVSNQPLWGNDPKRQKFDKIGKKPHLVAGSQSQSDARCPLYTQCGKWVFLLLCFFFFFPEKKA